MLSSDMVLQKKQYPEIQETCGFFLAWPQTYCVASGKKGIISLLPFSLGIFVYRLIRLGQGGKEHCKYLLAGAYIFPAQPQLRMLSACEKYVTSWTCSLVLGCLHMGSFSTSSLCVWRCLESTLDLYSLFSIHRPLNFAYITSSEFTVASQHQSNKCLCEKRRQFPFICFFLFAKSFSLLIWAFGLEQEQGNIVSILQGFKSKKTPLLSWI